MRRLTSALLLVGCAVPMLAYASSGSAGAAAAGTTCSKAAGTITFTPAIPVKGPVTIKITIKGTVSGCTGTVKSGTVAGTSKYAKKVDCAALISGSAGLPTGTQKITWNTKTTSTGTTHGVKTSNALNPRSQGTITAGTFKGLKTDQTLNVTKLNPSTACQSSGLKSLSYTQKTPLVIK